MSKTTNKFSPEVRQRAVRLVLDHEHEHASRWAAILSISAKIGCTGQTLNEWVKKAEIDAGNRAGVPTNMAAKLKALEARRAEQTQPLRYARKPPRTHRHLRHRVRNQHSADSDNGFFEVSIRLFQRMGLEYNALSH